MTYDLIILGGGPAGVAAGVYAGRKQMKTLLLTNNFGGQAVISSKIENFIGFKEISGFEMAKALEEHLRVQIGIDIKDGVNILSVAKETGGFRVSCSNGESYLAKNILVTLGKNYRKLGVKGEKEFDGKGVFYCSICDAPLMKRKNAAVIGGGNSGLNAVIDLLPYANEIYLLEHSDKLKGDNVLQERLKKEAKVKIIINADVEEIIGKQFVSGLKYKNSVTEEEKNLNLSGVFVEVGYKANSDLFKGLVEMNPRGEIVVDHKTFRTSCEGMWAAGDITDVLYNQINIAIGDAIKAVLNVYDEQINSKQ